jgi:hypothetical protein
MKKKKKTAPIPMTGAWIDEDDNWDQPTERKTRGPSMIEQPTQGKPVHPDDPILTKIKNDPEAYTAVENRPSAIGAFRAAWLEKGIELVNITPMLEFRLGISGLVNDFHEPNEDCYHLQGWYRHEMVAVFNNPDPAHNGEHSFVTDAKRYAIFVEDGDFIVFRQVKTT